MDSSIEQKIEQANKQDIDLAPLLDVVFILLIFFIVTTVFVRETGVDVDKPTAISSQDLQKSVLLLAITKRQEVIYGGTNIGVSGVRATLMQATRNEMRPLIIQSDRQVTTELLVKVIDQAKLAGIENVSIATVSE
ncbi:transport energizing protein, ExbD/TolR family protein [Teredinibacter turnerae T7901]|uniref:Transport energizing protein, ExbD/TolR family protein n=1 Tax=Teredinibacter turnerae (strain ATCC 39867 / T7901) TaxID=377629 RepID=C5BPW7_TERTT|nr:biopolymer transporter ExbD [Teredinibacter turnerae]ACR14078.1 transport energizing protein, ExbD/TolR family protein [Teredinibacter turnerae T7901]